MGRRYWVPKSNCRIEFLEKVSEDKILSTRRGGLRSCHRVLSGNVSKCLIQGIAYTCDGRERKPNKGLCGNPETSKHKKILPSLG